MKTTKLMIIALGSLALCGARAADEPVSPSPYEVVWDSPSPDCNGTMPLGNGEIALNAWIEPSGDLRFYIARTDRWDGSGRLVKVGAVRIKVGDGPAERTKKFRQILTAKDGTLSARYGEGDVQVVLRLWVDANRPVICVDAQTAKLPAWPKDWDCEFKLHAPYNTTVEGVIKAGKLKKLIVKPESRAKDVVNMLAK